MKNGPFKMRGYSYPGISPVKGKQLTGQAEKDQERLKKEEEARQKAKKLRDETSIHSSPNKPFHNPQPDPDLLEE